ncbi:hypothetical protein ACFL60_00945 [Candidatus Omnitrophota bacterium]
MKNTLSKCSICGKPVSVIISGKDKKEKLCVKCLVTFYPKLRDLMRMV